MMGTLTHPSPKSATKSSRSVYNILVPTWVLLLVRIWPVFNSCLHIKHSVYKRHVGVGEYDLPTNGLSEEFYIVKKLNSTLYGIPFLAKAGGGKNCPLCMESDHKDDCALSQSRSPSSKHNSSENDPCRQEKMDGQKPPTNLKASSVLFMESRGVHTPLLPFSTCLCQVLWRP